MTREKRDELGLSSLDRNILELIAEGFPTKQIADRLNISEPTAETYRTKLLKRLNAKNSANLIFIYYGKA